MFLPIFAKTNDLIHEFFNLGCFAFDLGSFALFHKIGLISLDLFTYLFATNADHIDGLLAALRHLVLLLETIGANDANAVLLCHSVE